MCWGSVADANSMRTVLDFPSRRTQRMLTLDRSAPTISVSERAMSTLRTMPTLETFPRGSKARTFMPQSVVKPRSTRVVWPFRVSTARRFFRLLNRASMTHEGTSVSRVLETRTESMESMLTSGSRRSAMTAVIWRVCKASILSSEEAMLLPLTIAYSTN